MGSFSGIKEAEGIRQSTILRAEGEAEAILSVQKAFADSLVMIREAGADEKVLALKSLETLKDLGSGTATKLFIPTELAGLGGALGALKEIWEDKAEPAANE